MALSERLRTNVDPTRQDRDSSVFSVVDLFCGCGGLTRGLERTGRFRTAFGVDTNRVALDTFVQNHGSPNERPIAHLGDIREVKPDEVWSALRRVSVTVPGELDCLVGGPPCEGFSRNKVYLERAGDADNDVGVSRIAPVEYRETKYWQSAWSASPISLNGADKNGRSVRAYNPFLNDPRNFLFRAFLDIADLLRPKIILIENVRQMLSHANGSIAEEIIARMKQLGYSAEARVLNAADFGVPQRRHRAFFVGVRDDLVKAGEGLPWPEPSHVPVGELPFFPSKAHTNLPGDHGYYVSVEEAIADLPPGKPERDGNPRQPRSKYPAAEMSSFRRFVRSQTCTPANHVYRTPSDQVINKLRAMRPGMKAHDMPQELQTRKYYYNAYGRLAWDEPANTITKSFLYPGSGKFGHPEEHRVISYREAARLQSFDDDFTFHASSQEGIASMIGSAVPPLLGFKFGLRFAALLERSRETQSSATPSGTKRRSPLRSRSPR
jgi:DNA (cytosine-5)-methyltransferase 1